jgi:hypothetical protein
MARRRVLKWPISELPGERVTHAACFAGRCGEHGIHFTLFRSPLTAGVAGPWGDG